LRAQIGFCGPRISYDASPSEYASNA